MFSLRAEVKKKYEAMEHLVQRLLRDSAGREPTEEFIRDLAAHLPALLDFGFHGDAYRLCETALEKGRTLAGRSSSLATRMGTAGAFPDALYFEICLLHLDLQRRRQLEAHARFVEELRAHPVAFIRAHGHSAAGFLDVLEGRLKEAEQRFDVAAELFRASHREADALKAAIRKLMVLRIGRRYHESLTLGDRGDS